MKTLEHYLAQIMMGLSAILVTGGAVEPHIQELADNVNAIVEDVRTRSTTGTLSADDIEYLKEAKENLQKDQAKFRGLIEDAQLRTNLNPGQIGILEDASKKYGQVLHILSDLPAGSQVPAAFIETPIIIVRLEQKANTGATDKTPQELRAFLEDRLQVSVHVSYIEPLAQAQFSTEPLIEHFSSNFWELFIRALSTPGVYILVGGLIGKKSLETIVGEVTKALVDWVRSHPGNRTSYSIPILGPDGQEVRRVSVSDHRSA